MKFGHFQLTYLAKRTLAEMRVLMRTLGYERLFSSYVQKTRAKNALENVGEIDPSRIHTKV